MGQDVFNMEELRKSLSQRIFWLELIYQQEDKNKLNSVIAPREVWLVH